MTGSAYSNAPRPSSRRVQQPFQPRRGEATPTDADGEGIHCPLCHYNLTGVESGRCPECGAFFSREALLESQATQQIALMPWDSPELMPIGRRLRQTLATCLVKADHFAFAFSVQPQRSKMPTFLLAMFLACLALAAAFVWLVWAVDPRPTKTPGDVVSLAAGVIAFLVVLFPSLVVMPALSLWVLVPHFDGRRHLAPWLSICGYASAHLLLLGACVPLAILNRGGQLYPVGLLSVMFVLGVVILWGCTMSAVIRHRGARGESGGKAVAIVVVCGLAATIMSLMAAAVASNL